MLGVTVSLLLSLAGGASAESRILEVVADQATASPSTTPSTTLDYSPVESYLLDGTAAANASQAAAAPLLPAPTAPECQCTAAPPDFATANGTSFVVNATSFHVVGANQVRGVVRDIEQPATGRSPQQLTAGGR